MDIFKLVGSVFVDTDEANKSLSKTDEKATSVGETLTKGIETAGKWAVGLTAGVTAVAAGVVNLATNAAETADVIDKASQRMDISAESYQELSHAASLCGVEMSTMEKAAKKLEGTDLNMDDALAQIYELGTAEERSAAAAELFGDSIAYNLSPMLNASAEEFAAMRQEANDLGLVLDGDAVSAGAELNDTINNVKDSFGAIITQLGASLMPIVKKVCDAIINYLPKIQSLVDKLGPVFMDLLDGLLPPLLDLAEQIFPILVDLVEQLLPPIVEIVEMLLPVFVELIQTLLPPILQIVQMVLPLIVQLLPPILSLLKPILDLLKPVLDLVMMILEPLIELINLILPPIITIVSQLFTLIANTVSPILEKFVGFLNGAFKVAFTVVMNVVQTFMSVITGAWDAIYSSTSKVFSSVKDTVIGTFEKIVEFIKKPVNAIIGIVNKVIDALNGLSFDVPDWVPGIGGKKFGFNLKSIPLLAKGGDVVEPGKAIVGEAGAELIDMPTGARVTPLTGDNGLHTEEILGLMASMLEEMKETRDSIVNAIGGIDCSISSDEIFTSVRRSAKSYKEQTGRLAW